MSTFQDFIKAEDADAVESLITCYGNKAERLERRIAREEIALQNMKNKKDELTRRVEALNMRADALHEEKLSPVKSAVKRWKLDVELEDTQAVDGDRSV